MQVEEEDADPEVVRAALEAVGEGGAAPVANGDLVGEELGVMRVLVTTALGPSVQVRWRSCQAPGNIFGGVFD